MHLDEGEAKRQMDERFKALKEGKGGPVPDRWADAEVQKMIYGTDVVATTGRTCREVFAAA